MHGPIHNTFKRDDLSALENLCVVPFITSLHPWLSFQRSSMMTFLHLKHLWFPIDNPRDRDQPVPLHAGYTPAPIACWDTQPLSHCMLGYTLPLWTEGMTHAFENITFPQLLLRAVKIP